MIVTLQKRTAEHVRIYFEKTNNDRIKRFLPQKARTVEEALEDYEKTLLPGANSFGQTIYADGRYIGDVWCYCIDPADEPNCMLSFCIFDQDYCSKGAASAAVAQFVRNMRDLYAVRTIGAFTFADNIASIRVLEKNGFICMEKFEEDGIKSRYYQRTI